MLEWADDLKIRDTSLYLDGRSPRARCFISHAHSDHLCEHASIIATPPTVALAAHRIGACAGTTSLEFNVDHAVDNRTTIRLLPAGHVLGSAMIHVTGPKQTLLYTGDFKLRPCLTVEPAETREADVLVMESTYGLPHFRFPPRDSVAAQLVDLCEGALRDNRQPIVMGYSLGKSQEICRILTGAGLNVTFHGAPHAVSGLYERFGVALGRYRRYAFDDFHGERPLDLRERGVLVAPPSVARSAFVARFDNPLRIIITGWALLKNAIFRFGVDHALPLSDHADFDELIELVERVRPVKIFTHHGYREFAEYLRKRGFDAEPAQPDRQLSLFGN